MPSWISKEGEFYPAKESVSLVNHGPAFEDPLIKGRIVETGMSYIYEGPCRAALFELWEAYGRPTKADMREKQADMKMGSNFRKSPEFLQMLRDLNFKSADEYLQWVGYDPERSEEEFKKKASVVTNHDLPKRVREVKRLGGGDNKANPREVRYGGFGDPTEN